MPDTSSAPGVVLFMVDQCSARWIEAAMAGAADVPNFRALAERGVHFTNAITSNPVCCPTRATIATGLTSRQHGVLENGYELDPALPTFMRQIQQAGWATGLFGKMHLWPHYKSLYPDYKQYGFDTTCVTEDPRGGPYLDWVRQNHPEHADSVMATVWAAGIPEFGVYGPEKEDLAPTIHALREKTDWTLGGKYPLASPGAFIQSFPDDVCQTSWITRRGLDFLDDLPAERPFFAQFSYVQPHGPFNVPEYCLDLVDESRIPEPVKPVWMDDAHPPLVFQRRYGGKMDLEAIRWSRRVYFADLAHLDRQLGRVLAALEAAKRLENTTIIFLSDHGDMLGDHNMGGKEDKHYDACIRVPLMVAGPRVAAAGRTCSEMVQLEDICPTILDVAGTSMPQYPTLGPNAARQADYPSLPGRSLLDLCGAHTPDDWRDAAYSGSYNAIWSADVVDWAQTVRTQQWRYTYYPDGAEQLFDVAADPAEQTNLIDDPAHTTTRNALRFRLMQLLVIQDYPRTRRELFALGVH